jgi:hypothetical protein
VSQETRTLGEVQMATEQSFVRMDLIVRRAQEAIEDLYQIRHAIWKRVLAEKGEDGVEAPQSLLSNLEGRGVTIDDALPEGKVTAQLLSGAFRFKPHGSVQTADPAKRRADWMQFLQVLPMLRQTMPLPSQNPVIMARAIWRETLRAFNVENQQAFIGSASEDLQAQQQAQMSAMLPMLMAAMGGGPPGLPAGAGAPQNPMPSPPQMPQMGGPSPMGGPEGPGGPGALPPAA